MAAISPGAELRSLRDSGFRSHAATNAGLDSLPYYERWLRRFPNIEKLALAPESEVLHEWQGLGYYSRARHLHAAAKILRTKYRDVFPCDPEELAKLPGAGRYTANAIATFAFNRCVPLVETNIGRVLARIFDLRNPIDASAGRNELWKIAAQLVPLRNARMHSSALMDLGATICVAGVPKCTCCPVRKHCRAKDPSTLPFKQPRRREKRLTEFHSFDYTRGRVLLEQSRRRWRGLWMLPSLEVKPIGQLALHVSEFSVTHHRITLAVFASPRQHAANKSKRWFRVRELAAIPIPSPHRRALNQLLCNRESRSA